MTDSLFTKPAVMIELSIYRLNSIKFEARFYVGFIY